MTIPSFCNMKRNNLMIPIIKDPKAMVPRWLRTTILIFEPRAQHGISTLFLVQYHFENVPKIHILLVLLVVNLKPY